MPFARFMSKPSICVSAVALAACGPNTDGTGIAGGQVDRLLSHGEAEFSASVPDIAVDSNNGDRVAVIWRDLAMSRPGEPAGERGMTCFLSLSSDGGNTFNEQELVWDMADTPVCNAPYVDIGPDGELLVGATLAGVLPQNAPQGEHAAGRVVMKLSTDWGKSWSASSFAIATGDESRFAANPAVPAASTHVPWDGARGVFDAADGSITLSGGFPAPPGEDLHSQRFISTSADGGRSWGPIYAFAAPGWPQRWDGHLISAHGKLAISYLADAVDVPDTECLCVVFATSNDDGATFERHLVAQVQDFDALVHYPPVAANPVRDANYALATVAKEQTSPVVRVTEDSGRTWKTLESPISPEGVVRASRPAIAFTPGGQLALVWRGYYSNNSYDTFAAAARDDGVFGKPVLLSEERSVIPEELLNDYSARGDFLNVIAASTDMVHASWTDWRSGAAGQVYYGRVPLSVLLPQD